MERALKADELEARVFFADTVCPLASYLGLA